MSQAAAEQFARSLRVLDGIYAEVSGDERYLVHSKTTQHDSWIISVTDLSEGLWEKEVFFEEMQHQVPPPPWRRYPLAKLLTTVLHYT
jgi:hypothetical protein